MTPLRQRMLEDLQIRQYSRTTIRIYLHAVTEFAQHFGKPPDRLGAEHIRQYQLFLVKEKKVSRPTRQPEKWEKLRSLGHGVPDCLVVLPVQREPIER